MGLLQDSFLKQSLPKRELPKRGYQRKVDEFSIKAAVYNPTPSLWDKISKVLKEGQSYFVISYAHILAAIGLALIIGGMIWVSKIISNQQNEQIEDIYAPY